MPTLLVVDDKPENLELMVRRLSRKGFAVLVADSAREGLALARDKRPDLILMDMSMPEMDGYEATTLLKADPETKAIPVIGLTAFALPEERDRAVAAGVDEYETKPVDLPRLLEKIAQFLPPGG